LKQQRAATLRNDATIGDSNRTCASWTAEHETMANDAAAEQERMRRFRDVALPHLDEVYTLARYLMRNTDDAEDAVQECYLRALHHFDSYRGPAMKPWLLAILRNVCKNEFTRRRRGERPTDYAQAELVAEEMPMWQEPQASPENTILQQQDTATIRRLVAELPAPFREAIVLREMNDLSYKEIAEVAGVPVGTVMSRLARARAMLRAAWNAAETVTTQPGSAVASGTAL
jgi:RNA polymerase sigma-70 factor (ECF subfamily)